MKNYVGKDALTRLVHNIKGALAKYLPLAGGTMSGEIKMGTHKVSGLAAPTEGTDAATKTYVDSHKAATATAADTATSATTATKLATAQSIGLSGDASGSTTFDGSKAATIPVTLASTLSAAASAGPTAAASPGFGGKFQVPRVSFDVKGRATAVTGYDITLPAAPTSVSGNAGSATKLATARAIGVAGDVVGQVNFTGEGNAVPTVVRRGCVVGQSGTADAAKPWYKFASATTTAIYDDWHITFHVWKGYSDMSTSLGILTAHFRVGNPATTFENGQLMWEYADSGIDPSRYVMVHGVNGSSTIVELWVNDPESHVGVHFDVISEGNRTSRRTNKWGLITDYKVGGAASTTTGYTSIASTLATIRNSLNGDARGATVGRRVNITLTAAGWGSDMTQKVTATGVNASETAQLVVPAPAMASQDAYYSAQIIMTKQEANAVTFKCKSKPTVNLTVYLILFTVG